jgi:hypothetical protein
MVKKLKTTNGKYNMGLLDYLNKGFDNSVGHLNNLKDSFANQPKMYDPHANAQALMGGQAMQYNQQPQSLIAEQVNAPTTQASFTPQAPTEQQTQQMTYQGTPQAGVNYPNYDSSAINPYLDGDQTDGNGGYVDNSYNNRLNSATASSLLMGNAQTPQGVVGVDPDAPVYNTPTDNIDYSKEAQVEVGQPQVSVSGPFDWLNSLLAPNVDREELIRRGIIPPK